MQSNSNKSPTGICADHFWEDSLQGRQSTSPLSKFKPKKGKGDSRGFLRFLIFSQFCSTLRCAVSLPDLISHQKWTKRLHKSMSCETLSRIQRRIWQSHWNHPNNSTAMPVDAPSTPQIPQDIWKLQSLVTVARVEAMSQCPGVWGARIF